MKNYFKNKKYQKIAVGLLVIGAAILGISYFLKNRGNKTTDTAAVTASTTDPDTVQTNVRTAFGDNLSVRRA